MLKRLLAKFSTTLYVQIWEDRLKVVDVATGGVFDEAPLVAIETTAKGQKQIVAVGNKAKLLPANRHIEVVNPFFHPRALLNDFSIAEKLLQHAFKTLLSHKWLAPSPAVIIHPMEKIDGGLTMIEERAFRELGLGAGARDVEVYLGSELPIKEVDFAKLSASKEPSKASSSNSFANTLIWIVVLIVFLWVMRN